MIVAMNAHKRTATIGRDATSVQVELRIDHSEFIDTTNAAMAI